MIDQNELRERTKEYIAASGVKKSTFANIIGFARENYYRWIKGDFDFGNEKAMRIDEHLRKFGY